jgi:hypothetical protein
MLKRFSQFFAYLLLVLMPLQGIAAANMAACNALMQANMEGKQAQTMPCHEHAANKAKPGENYKNGCKATCAALCASLCAMTAIPSNIKSPSLLVTTQSVVLADQAYISITQPNLQRPPIFFS